MAILAFQDAEKARDAIVASQRQEIAGLYAQWADEIERSSKRFAGGKNPSDALKSIQMQQLMRNVRSAGKIVSNGIDNVVRGNMYTVADAVVQANSEWMAELGFDTTGLNVNFTTVPERIVERLVTGQVYQGGWNLSQRIWGDNEKVMAELYQIAARGAVENKSIQEIAKDMAGHVSPSAQKPWNKVIAMKNTTTGAIEYKRMYTRKVDYNAQRLARTLVQHSYQQSFVAVTKDNPFVMDYIWHADGSRPCELCEERDGMHFAKDDLPMDHPNGMCTMEPSIDEKFIDRLADWVNSPEGTYPEIDEFATNVGYESKTNIGSAIVSTLGGIEKIPDLYLSTNPYFDEKKEHAFATQQAWDAQASNVTKKDLKFIQGPTGYVQSTMSFDINAELRANPGKAPNEIFEKGSFQEVITKTLDKAIEKSQLSHDGLFYRFAEADSLESIYGTSNVGKLVGTVTNDPAYLSVSANVDLSKYSEYTIERVIYAESGTKAYITKNWEESEVIFGRHTETVVEAVEVNDNKITVYERLRKKNNS